MAAETLDPVLPKRVQERAERALDAAHDKELKLATAEGCTGGLLAALLTDVRGRGHMFDRGFVVYSKQAKCDLLGIAREKVDNCGAVSEPIAREMALGALRRSTSRFRLPVLLGQPAPTTTKALSISPAPARRRHQTSRGAFRHDRPRRRAYCCA
ncbi:MAG TPA: CinA family protein [Croceibacterium sp.]|nr:CinA family protein [Croceibacterium sp.]